MSALTSPRASTRLPFLKGDAMKISELSRSFLMFTRSRGGSPRTIEVYDDSISRFVAWLIVNGKDDSLREFTPKNIEAWIDHLATKGLKASSINTCLAALASLGEYGMKTQNADGKYHLAENPLARVYRPKRQKPAERHLYREEILALLKVDAHPVERLLLLMVVDTSLRASELANARVRDLTADGDKLRLAVIVKGGRPRTVTLGREVGALLLEHLKLREPEPGDPLLVGQKGRRLTRGSISWTIQKLATKAGITRTAVRAHLLGRHSMATLASGAGVDVPTIAALLNHSDLNTVSRYVHRGDAVDSAREQIRRLLHGQQDG
jgi:site-specific recombinase XerD